MIVSFREGRARLRSPALREAGALEKIGGMLAALEGILKTEGNARTGSLLVLYDPSVISGERLHAAAAMLEDVFPVPDGSSAREKARGTRKAEKRLLLAGALLTLIGAACGSRTLHVAAGSFFILMASKHLYDRRKAL
jgi:hypothetical protein